MKTLTTRLLNIFTLSIVCFIILFDIDGAQLGVEMWNNIPLWIITIASILGNIVWIFGALLMLVGVALLSIVVSDHDIMMKKSVEALNTDEKVANLYRKDHVTTIISTMLALVALGSGFWFTGTGWLLSIIGVTVWKKSLIDHKEKLDKENGIEKPFSSLDLAKSNLLDD